MMLPMVPPAAPRFAPLAAILLVGLLPSAAGALDHFNDLAELDSGTSLSPVTGGARALGMADAFVAVADDTTAATRNPAGLVQLDRPDVLVSLSIDNITRSFTGAGTVGGRDGYNLNFGDLSHVGLSIPFWVGRHRLVVAVALQSRLRLATQIRRSFTAAVDTDIGIQQVVSAEPMNALVTKDGVLRSLSPSVGFEIGAGWSVGLAVDLWTDELGYPNGWTQRETLELTATPLPVLHRNKESYDFNGLGATIGVLWRIDDRWRAAAVFATPVWGRLRRTIDIHQRVENQTIRASDPLARELIESLNLPPSYSLGVTFRPHGRVLLSAELGRTEWALATRRKSDLHNGSRRTMNPLTDRNRNRLPVWGSTTLRFGAEYRLGLGDFTMPLRAGLAYDMVPAVGIIEHQLAVTGGVGIALAGASLDVAYRLEVVPSAVPQFLALRGSADAVPSPSGGWAARHQVIVSARYRFDEL